MPRRSQRSPFARVLVGQGRSLSRQARTSKDRAGTRNCLSNPRPSNPRRLNSPPKSSLDRKCSEREWTRSTSSPRVPPISNYHPQKLEERLPGLQRETTDRGNRRERRQCRSKRGNLSFRACKNPCCSRTEDTSPWRRVSFMKKN